MTTITPVKFEDGGGGHYWNKEDGVVVADDGMRVADQKIAEDQLQGDGERSVRAREEKICNRGSTIWKRRSEAAE